MLATYFKAPFKAVVHQTPLLTTKQTLRHFFTNQRATTHNYLRLSTHTRFFSQEAKQSIKININTGEVVGEGAP